MNLSLCPTSSNSSVDWSELESELRTWVEPMKKTPQEPLWHAEGDVWTHTRMVVESLLKLDDWKNRNEKDRVNLFFAALLHDVAKPICTRIDNGQIKSPKHALKGSILARKILWTHFDLAGTAERMEQRERIASLVRLHSLPYKLVEREEPIRDIVRASLLAQNDELATLSTADILGRISEQTQRSLEKVEFFKQFATENDCFTQPYRFASQRSRFAYLNGTLEHPAQELYDETWGEVVLMSGLPASGKDYYVAEHYADREVISLDAIRQELKISWTDNQQPVIQTAKERAKEFLRKKTPFVWNATNIVQEIRSSLIRLFSSYGARVHIVYLETQLPTLLLRNKQRENPVAESAIFKMLDKLEVPNVLEADSICWIGN